MTSLVLALALLPPTVTFAAVGDVMLGRYVGRRIEREGPASVFAKVPSIKDADLAFGNLECVLSRRPFAVSKRVLLRGVPASTQALQSSGFAVMSVANNHALDAGLAGRKDTEDALARIGIRAVGGSDFATTVTVKGLRIALIAHSDFPNMAGDAVVADEIRALRATHDVVILSWHWGEELSKQVSPRQRQLATQAAEAGADLVIGHHPHVQQPIEWIEKGGRRCLVAYSLGNFVFDARTASERESKILHVLLSTDGVKEYLEESVQIRNGFPVSDYNRASALNISKAPGPRTVSGAASGLGVTWNAW